ncbi:nucleolar protein dao-5-like isoform X2 [Chaetodon trifascialis]|uniref:nucleolar protein dao-5-like isoform X2 n=2 Tax=Chaetodon trifascialis TaxID=109706 RepID=UPI003994F14D
MRSIKMDCSTADEATNVVQDSPALDDSSDDEPLIKMKTVSAPAKRPVTKNSPSTRSNGTHSNKADESSDNEPLIKIAKVSSKAVNKSFTVPPKKTVSTKERESQDNADGSDDEPLSELAKRLQSKPQRKASVVSSRKATPVMKSKRNSAKKTVKYAESSSDDSDDEPLATTKRKLTKALEEQKSKKTKQKLKDKSLKDSSSDDDDDDVPLVNLIAKKKPVKKNTKTTAVSHGSASRNRRGLSDDSSEDEPLINFVKKNRTDKQTKTKMKASAQKKRDTAPEKPTKILVSGSSNDSSDDEPLIKAAKHPQVTKIVRIILERCDGEETGAARSVNKTRAGTPTAEKSEESDGSEQSPEEA